MPTKTGPNAQLCNNPLKHGLYFCSFFGSTHLYGSSLPLMSTKRILLLIMISASSCAAFSQKKAIAKYPSLFWEITGNGLAKPSYLFGTMHVSSKMVFHLSDSFYLAIKNVDAVALELNPDLWQGQMVSLDKLKQNYANFTQTAGNDFLNENSFRISKYEDELKEAMSTEPTVVNSLLYRSYKSKEDFEEDTFLDLYIFQTGKRLGKRATGAENYFETEKLIMEANMDMALEKKKKTIDTDGDSNEDIVGKIQDAYRKGDLDLMDSLDRMMERSDAFREKFLYKRNEIQANSMDTIMQKSSLFVGVGAAHLAGDRGVIELLRKKGYTLRPIQMPDRDALQKESIDKMKVPVEFATRQSDDGFYSVSMPGPLFKLGDDNQGLDRRQYSDMSNGAYYIVTRVKTHAAFLGQDQQAVMKKVDSILYENIPGKILSKKNINRNGYPGYDISNRTRRGDLQRYNIFVTPFEVLIFKMSGNENYVDGKEADQFFSSIGLKQTNTAPLVFQPAQGGFSVKFPQAPHEYLNTTDDNGRWEYEAVDPATGDAYLVFKESVYNFHFLDQDTFDLSLVEESFRGPDYFDKQVSRTPGLFSGYPSLDVKEKMKDGSEVRARYIIKGPDYYVIAARSRNRKNAFKDFFDSFRFTGYTYSPPTTYVDTFMHFSVSTPITPVLDDSIRRLVEKATYEVPLANNYSGYSPYWPKSRNGLFRNDSTGEEIGIAIQEYPKYYYVRDPANFWKNELASYGKTEMVLFDTDSIKTDNLMTGYKFSFRDTGSSRIISRMVVFKGNYRYSLVSIGDSLTPKSTFIDRFFNSFKVLERKPAKSIFDNRLGEFFKDLFSSDSSTHAKAQQSISNIYYGEKGIPMIMAAIARLKISDKDYFETKLKLIGELGYIKDSTQPMVVGHLKKISGQVKDTSLFENQVLLALSHHKTTEAYKLFKDLVLEDPPLFESKYEYNNLFASLDDSLQLTRILFPDLLQLATLDDYKDKVLGLLVTLVDSGKINAGDYENYFPKIYFDARIELKKQQGKDEKQMEQDSRKDADQAGGYRYNNYGNAGLRNYQVLLAPFYDKNPNVPHFFERLLQSKDPMVRLNAAVLMLRNNITVPDSVLQNLAAMDQFRGRLYSRLEKAKRLDKFPAQYKNQLDLARSYLVEDKDYDKIDSIVFLKKQQATYPGKRGTVYFFKYRIKKEGDWKIGLSGLQPENEKEVSSDDALSTMTDKKLRLDESMDDQLQKQLRKLLFDFHKSAKNFYSGDDVYSRYRKLLKYQEE